MPTRILAAQPVGGVIAYERQISISAVGSDIGRDNTATRLDSPFTAISDRVPSIPGDIHWTISFGIGRVNAERASMLCWTTTRPGRHPTLGAYRQKAAASWAGSARAAVATSPPWSWLAAIVYAAREWVVERCADHQRRRDRHRAPAPARLIEGGTPTGALVAQVVARLREIVLTWARIFAYETYGAHALALLRAANGSVQAPVAHSAQHAKSNHRSEFEAG